MRHVQRRHVRYGTTSLGLHAHHGHHHRALFHLVCRGARAMGLKIKQTSMSIELHEIPRALSPIRRYLPAWPSFYLQILISLIQSSVSSPRCILHLLLPV